MPGRLDFTLQFAKPGQPTRLRPDTPMRLLILGDFGGRGMRGLFEPQTLAQRAMPAVDGDNFDAVLASTAPMLTLAGAGMEIPVELTFRALDDFHPDALVRHVAPLAKWLDLRGRLSHPATFAQAAAELPTLATTATEAHTAAAGFTTEDDAETLSRLLGGHPHTPVTAAARAQDPLADFLRQVVTPSPGDIPRQDVYLAAAEEAVSTRLRALLHHPDFQALEAIWRGLSGLVSELGGDGEVRIHLFDATRAELAADLAAAGDDPARTGLAHRLAGEDLSWSCLVGDFEFDDSADDLALLAGLGAIAAQVGAPFLAAAKPGLLACESLEQLQDSAQWPTPEASANSLWQAFRRSSIAPWIGLALPRLLLRLPYGPRQEHMDSFVFRELPTGVIHDQLLWGNPALGLALLLGQAFLASAWDMSPDDSLQLDGLPALVHEVEGERRLYPCAEAWISERTAEAMLAEGLMPLMSYRDRNAARLPRFQSIAEPSTALAGPWRD